MEHQKLNQRLVEFLVFNSIHQLISFPSDEVYRVGDGGPDHAVVPHVLANNYLPPSAEGRVDHQKLNQTAALLSFGSVFGVQLDSPVNKFPL